MSDFYLVNIRTENKNNMKTYFFKSHFFDYQLISVTL